MVRGMKKHTSDFVKRYGKDAESVMHAVATKQAKDEEFAEQDDIVENIFNKRCSGFTNPKFVELIEDE